jgi:hypothetical protein
MEDKQKDSTEEKTADTKKAKKDTTGEKKIQQKIKT